MNITVLLSSIVVFLIIILLLVVILLVAKRYLVPSGKVKITINDDTTVEAETGASLLSTLAAQKIFLPSACGGGGACGMCKCQVLEGGGELLPTETGFITRKMAKEHWRLGCQVKVKENMNVNRL